MLILKWYCDCHAIIFVIAFNRILMIISTQRTQSCDKNDARELTMYWERVNSENKNFFVWILL